MSLKEILDTFSIYKNELDEIYKKYCKKDYIKGHDGINHCFVMRLIDQNVQLKMLQKLTDIYSNTNNTTVNMVFILKLFKKKNYLNLFTKLEIHRK